jgi:hypothetical protein
LSNEENKKILELKFDVKPFLLKVISIKRIFIDKIFATEFYYERKIILN